MLRRQPSVRGAKSFRSAGSAPYVVAIRREASAAALFNSQTQKQALKSWRLFIPAVGWGQGTRLGVFSKPPCELGSAALSGAF